VEIDYIALFVKDVERSLVFYRDVLKFEFTKPIKNGGTDGYSGSIKVGIYDRSWLEKLLGDRGSKPISGNPILLSITVKDLDQVYQELLSAQVSVFSAPQVMPWGQKLVFLEDPDGNLLEIVEKSEI
jgi:lactoylglutathione lyase